MRIGQGFDVHKFGGDGPVIIGGVEIPYHQGLLAHSDGDVLLHALSDALLGAVAAGDIGQLFPDTDAAYAGADSAVLLQKVYEVITSKGFQLVNADLTIIAQAPKIAPYKDAICKRISTLLMASQDVISVKATTSEKLGFTGREEGIAAMAVVLLEPNR